MRLFVALTLPPDVAARAADLLPASIPALRRVAPENLHLTLAFLGETPESQLPAVAAAVADAASEVPAFVLKLDRAGQLPERGRPHAVVLSVAAGGESVERLGAAVRQHLREAGLDFDHKPLAPHVTLARLVDEADQVQARTVRVAVRGLPAPRLEIRVGSVAIVQSVLSPRGPRYTVRSTQPLG